MKYQPIILLHKNLKQSHKKALSNFGKWLEGNTPYTFEPIYKEVDFAYEYHFVTEWQTVNQGLKNLYAIKHLEGLLRPYAPNDVWLIHDKGDTDKYVANYTWQYGGFIGYEIVTKKSWTAENLERVLRHEFIHGRGYEFKLPQVHQILDTYYKEHELNAPDGNRAVALKILANHWNKGMINWNNDLDILTRTLIGEYATGTYEEIAAVGHVIRNRAARKQWPNTIRGVCLQPYQFSCWNENDPQRARIIAYSRTSPVYKRVNKIALDVMSGSPDTTKGADHYLNPVVTAKKWGLPKWVTDNPHKKTVKIGEHDFYNLHGQEVKPDRATIINLAIKLLKVGQIDLAKKLLNLL